MLVKGKHNHGTRMTSRTRTTHTPPRMTTSVVASTLPLLENQPFSIENRVIAYISTPSKKQQEQNNKSNTNIQPAGTICVSSIASALCIGDVQFRPHSRMGIFSYRIDFTDLKQGEFVEQVELQNRETKQVVSDLLWSMQQQQQNIPRVFSCVIGSVHLTDTQIQDLLKRRLQILITTNHKGILTGQLKSYNGRKHDEKYKGVFIKFGLL